MRNDKKIQDLCWILLFKKLKYVSGFGFMSRCVSKQTQFYSFPRGITITLLPGKFPQGIDQVSILRKLQLLALLQIYGLTWALLRFVTPCTFLTTHRRRPQRETLKETGPR